MAERERIPFGLDAAALIDVISTCWRAHDGQWFLKVAAERGLEEAMRYNERAIASIARIELREIRRLAGLGSLDTLRQVAEWYRLALIMFGGQRRPPISFTVRDDETLVVESERCFGEPIAEQSGYGHLAPGDYPPCRGWLDRQRAWGEVLSERYVFAVTREPREGRPCRYVVRREPRDES